MPPSQPDPPAPPAPPDSAALRPPGPNQWFKDHLDALIDAELMVHFPAASARAGGRARWLPQRRALRKRS
jgi:hypothetical protein